MDLMWIFGKKPDVGCQGLCPSSCLQEQQVAPVQNRLPGNTYWWESRVMKKRWMICAKKSGCRSPMRGASEEPQKLWERKNWHSNIQHRLIYHHRTPADSVKQDPFWLLTLSSLLPWLLRLGKVRNRSRTRWRNFEVDPTPPLLEAPPIRRGIPHWKKLGIGEI